MIFLPIDKKSRRSRFRFAAFTKIPEEQPQHGPSPATKKAAVPKGCGADLLKQELKKSRTPTGIQHV
jgi:hypothetical protein